MKSVPWSTAVYARCSALNAPRSLARQELLCQAAARSGQLEKLKLLRAGGCPWDWGTCYGAAKGGHFEVLQWVRANGCPWDVETCWGAAEGGHLEVLQWARANGAPWNED